MTSTIILGTNKEYQPAWHGFASLSLRLGLNSPLHHPLFGLVLNGYLMPVFKVIVPVNDIVSDFLVAEKMSRSEEAGVRTGIRR